MCLGISAYFDTTLLDSRIISTWLALYFALHALTMIIHEGHLLIYYSSWTSPLHTRIIVARSIPVERIRHHNDQMQLPTATSNAEDTEPYEPGMLVHVQREQYYRRTACQFSVRKVQAEAVITGTTNNPAERLIVEGAKVCTEYVDTSVWQTIWFLFVDPSGARFTGGWPFPHFYHPATGMRDTPFGGRRHILYPKPFVEESRGAQEETHGGKELIHGQVVTLVGCMSMRSYQKSVAQLVFAALDSEPMPPTDSTNENCTRMIFPELFDHANGTSYPCRVHLSGADRDKHMGEYEHMAGVKGPSPVYKKRATNGMSTDCSYLFAYSARWHVAEITAEVLERAKGIDNHRELFNSANISDTVFFQSKQAPRHWLPRWALPLPVGDNQDWKTAGGDDVPCFRVSANIRIETRHSIDVPFDSFFNIDFPPEYASLSFQDTKSTISYVSGSYKYKEDMRVFPNPEPTKIDNWIRCWRSGSFDNPKYTQRKRCLVNAGAGGNTEVHWCNCTSCAQLETVAILSGDHKFRTGKLKGGSLNGTNCSIMISSHFCLFC
jgi:hypothetical protein